MYFQILFHLRLNTTALIYCWWSELLLNKRLLNVYLIREDDRSIDANIVENVSFKVIASNLLLTGKFPLKRVKKGKKWTYICVFIAYQICRWHSTGSKKTTSSGISARCIQNTLRFSIFINSDIKKYIKICI